MILRHKGQINAIFVATLCSEHFQRAGTIVKYNFFLHLYDLQGYNWVQIPEEDGGILKYRIPYLDKQPLSGTMDLKLSYPVITYDTIYYTFYVYDRDFNRSNIDSTDVIVLSGIDLDDL